MVKDSKTAPPKPGPLPRRPRGRPPTGEEIRDHRMMLRVNQSLVDLLDIRAAERGESRSRFIEKLLIAFLRSDPRNPKLDPNGRILTDGPALSRTTDAVRFGAAWARWSSLNENIFGLRPPDEWMEEPPETVDLKRGGRARQPDMDD